MRKCKWGARALQVQERKKEKGRTPKESGRKRERDEEKNMNTLVCKQFINIRIPITTETYTLNCIIDWL